MRQKLANEIALAIIVILVIAIAAFALLRTEKASGRNDEDPEIHNPLN